MGSFFSKMKRGRSSRCTKPTKVTSTYRPQYMTDSMRVRDNEWQKKHAARQRADREALAQMRRDREQALADLIEFKDWYTFIVQERNRRATIYRRKIRNDEGWAPRQQDKTGCAMGRSDCECNRGIDFGKFLNNRVPVGTKFACYAQVERELRRTIGPCPKPNPVSCLPAGWAL
ncbi:hypothetical protein NLG97_g1962 [Lecanicillium saksenae]|uniref:Uncharacterized protein n=1 Tax=Lecanicillium saksenae TaxID=468837 RepID=A0ACC1R5P8_9HYPO|nr:hypothetical protein NLG97_g1962 [Lecanicillium saksenae]